MMAESFELWHFLMNYKFFSN